MNSGNNSAYGNFDKNDRYYNDNNSGRSPQVSTGNYNRNDYQRQKRSRSRSPGNYNN